MEEDGYSHARALGSSLTDSLDEDEVSHRRGGGGLRRAALGRVEARDESSAYTEAMQAKELQREKEMLMKQIQAAREAQQAKTIMAAPPLAPERKKTSRWDQTPMPQALAVVAMQVQATPLSTMPLADRKRSRWDQTPVAGGPAQTPLARQIQAAIGESVNIVAATQNRPWTDEDLEDMLPSEGYEIVKPPPEFASKQLARAASLFAPPTPGAGGIAVDTDGDASAAAGFQIQTSRSLESYGVSFQKSIQDRDVAGIAAPTGSKQQADLPYIKPEDMQYFGILLEAPPQDMDKDEETSRHVLTLLLNIKNGTTALRKISMRQISDEALTLGAGPLFTQILPILMSPTLDEQERHLLVKVVDRVLLRLEDAVRPFAHKILAVIEPLLIEEDFYARVEGREIIANLAKACGLATMIATMRPDIDNPDEDVRNTTARALSVVASALGVQSMMPFLRAVCRSKKSWEARQTGTKVVQQISVLMGCGVLPHVQALVECIAPGVKDEQQKVRTMTALALASLAESAHPYGYESFAPVLDSLWDGIAKHRGKGLAAFIKAMGFIIPLMDEDNARLASQRIVPILVREFKTPDEDTKKIVLKAVKQIASTEGITASFLRDELLGGFFESFWIRRNALDKRNYEVLVDTTVSLATRVGAGEVLERLVGDFKDESEPFRRMIMDCTDRVLKEMGSLDINTRLEERLVDGALFAFQEQEQERGDDPGGVMLRGFVRVVSSLGKRAKAYLTQIAATAKWRLQHKNPAVRMQAADLISGLAPTLKTCEEEERLGHLGVILYENLGEEFPDVLGSILGALKAIVVAVGVEDMTPPIRDLLPRLTPILRNSNDKVAENLIDLIGRIADAGATQVAAREWMRICFDLLEMLRSPRMSIRRAAVSTFGYIARAVGPQDVLHTLLTNLRVQERQMRVCTTVAIAIVAESCAPFTVLPGVMNEYKQPDVNVQNGVLKALSFMMQYIGPAASDYIYALTPLLQDALSDRDHVHRQTACDAVKHLALSLAGRGCEDTLVHLLNYVFPNVFEQSPHVARAVLEAIEALRVPLGAGRMLLYIMPGLFHPARFVRSTYWRLYNNLYIGDTDGLVPYYPRFELVPCLPVALSDDVPAEDLVFAVMEAERQRERLVANREKYRRTYLELFI